MTVTRTCIPTWNSQAQQVYLSQNTLVGDIISSLENMDKYSILVIHITKRPRF